MPGLPSWSWIGPKTPPGSIVTLPHPKLGARPCPRSRRRGQPPPATSTATPPRRRRHLFVAHGALPSGFSMPRRCARALTCRERRARLAPASVERGRAHRRTADGERRVPPPATATVVWLGSADGGVGVVGGKAASLDRLARLGFRDPARVLPDHRGVRRAARGDRAGARGAGRAARRGRAPPDHRGHGAGTDRARARGRAGRGRRRGWSGSSSDSASPTRCSPSARRASARTVRRPRTPACTRPSSGCGPRGSRMPCAAAGRRCGARPPSPIGSARA